jgi:hypothetical protein
MREDSTSEITEQLHSVSPEYLRSAACRELASHIQANGNHDVATMDNLVIFDADSHNDYHNQGKAQRKRDPRKSVLLLPRRPTRRAAHRQKSYTVAATRESGGEGGDGGDDGPPPGPLSSAPQPNPRGYLNTLAFLIAAAIKQDEGAP